MSYSYASFAAACVACIVLCGCNSGDEDEAGTLTQTGHEVETRSAGAAAGEDWGPMSVEDSAEVTVTSRVKRINHGTRHMTLEDAQGHEVSFRVDEGVRRLNEVMVGDNVNVRYRAHVLAERRTPTVDEMNRPIAMYEVAGKTAQGATPAAGAADVVRVLTTVEAVDVPNKLVTLRGPMGDLAVVRGRNEENLRRLNIGDTIILTYTESVAISLEKLAPR